MTNFRNDLLTRMIRIYGFEHPLVIQFAEMCEAYIDSPVALQWDNCLRSLVECHEAEPYFPEDED